MKQFPVMAAAAIVAAAAVAGCGGKTSAPEQQTPQFVTVGDDGQFYRGDSVYRFRGTNFWYGPILASDGPGGDYDRLVAELDSLKAMGITNLRVLAGAEGPDSTLHHISPVLQPEPGVYNEDLLKGLDRFIAELEKRDMTAVIYLTNAWEWSGGYGSYLQWTGHGPCPDPADGYNEYVDHVAQFVLDTAATNLYLNHVRNMVGRTNSVTGKPYSQSPAIMAWQVANEPRAFSEEGKNALAHWIRRTAREIKAIDTNHLVSTGSEGSVGCQLDLDLWKRIHMFPEIDYAIIHLWPTNWGWARRDSSDADLKYAIQYSGEYITEHLEAIKPHRKPLVIEEFGYPRAGFSFDINAAVDSRDEYYRYIIERFEKEPGIGGFNFWGWNGFGRPQHQTWQPGDPFLCDPAHEPQGMYGVFSCDSSTIAILRGK